MARDQWDELIAHARDEAPNECCGYGYSREGKVEELVRAENVRNSPYGYEFGFDTLMAVNELDERNDIDVLVYHSHPATAAEPSQTDINLAQYPHWTYLIVSLDGDPGVRAWRISDGRVEEEEIDVR